MGSRKRNGIIVTGYSVKDTLAHDLKAEPDTVTMTDGRKIPVRATIKTITFSAHSDYNQTSEFIQKLKANVVVLVHGEEYEMNRMRTKLREEYADLNVCAPQNCQTVALRVPMDRSADAVGQIAEELTAGAKRTKTEVSGLLVEEANGSRMLLNPDDLAEFTTLSACTVEQCQRFAFPLSLSVLTRALKETYDDITVADGCLCVCDCVRAVLSQQVLSVTWQASPITDLVADSVALTAIELTRSPAAVQALQSPEDVGGREARLFRVLCTYLHQGFGVLQLDEEAQIAKFEVDGSHVAVDFPSRAVECDNEALKERVRSCLRRCETALRPVAAF